MGRISEYSVLPPYGRTEEVKLQTMMGMARLPQEEPVIGTLLMVA